MQEEIKRDDLYESMSSYRIFKAARGSIDGGTKFRFRETRDGREGGKHHTKGGIC